MCRFNVEEIRSRMKKSSVPNGPSSTGVSGRSESDYLLWDEFKVAGFSRTLSAIYICSMLHALIKVQLSIVSRYVLFDQQAQQARQEAEQAARERGELPPLTPAQTNAAAPAASTGASASAAAGPAGFPALPSFLPPHTCE